MWRRQTWALVFNERIIQFTKLLGEFLNCFHRRTVLDGDVLFQEELSTVAEELGHRAVARMISPTTWEAQGLNVGQMMRLEEHHKKHAGLVQRGKKGISDAMLCDLEQSPDHYGRLGQYIASLITHNCFWSERMKRPLLRHEALSAQG